MAIFVVGTIRRVTAREVGSPAGGNEDLGGRVTRYP